MQQSTSGPAEHLSNPKAVSAIEYCNFVIRAHDQAGLMIDRGHVFTIRQKLLDELQLPRIRVLQVLNRLADADLTGKKTIEVPIADIRAILQMGKDL